MLRDTVIESRPRGDDEEVVHDVIGLIQSGLKKKREEGEESDRKRERGIEVIGYSVSAISL